MRRSKRRTGTHEPQPRGEIDVAPTPSRRGILVGGAVGLGALVSDALASATPAAAANGGAVLLGQTNSATAPTVIGGSSSTQLSAGAAASTYGDAGAIGYGGGAGLVGLSDGATATSPFAGVWGKDTAAQSGGTGVWGDSANGVGLTGTGPIGLSASGSTYGAQFSDTATGAVPLVAAVGVSDNGQPAIRATSAGTGSALEASVDNASPSVAATNTGAGVAIFGGDNATGTGSAIEASLTNAANNAAALQASSVGGGNAVIGRSASAPALVGISGTSAGVVGTDDATGTGPGVWGDLTNDLNPSVAVLASTLGTGNALQAQIDHASSPAAALWAGSNGVGPAVFATDAPPLEDNSMGTGSAILANLANPANASSAIKATTAGTGPALEAQISSPTNSQAVIAGTTAGSGAAVVGQITSPTNAQPAVSGSTAGHGPGVLGSSIQSGGCGVQGQGTHGAVGVHGLSDAGSGVHGESSTGVGVLAQSSAGTALQVSGKVVLSRSGTVPIKAHASSVRVTFAGVSPASVILATIQGASGGVGVANVITGKGTFTITLTGAAPSNLRVGFMILN